MNTSTEWSCCSGGIFASIKAANALKIPCAHSLSRGSLQERDCLEQLGTAWSLVPPPLCCELLEERPFLSFFFFFFWLHLVACRTFVPQPGIILVPSSLGVQSLNHWASKEVPGKTCLIHPPSCNETADERESQDPLLPSLFPEHSNPISPDLHHPGLAVVLRVCS